VIPFLEKTIELVCKYASFFPHAGHIADPLIDQADSGMTVATILQLLPKTLRDGLVPMVDAICRQSARDDSCLTGQFPINQQMAYGRVFAKKWATTSIAATSTRPPLQARSAVWRYSA
jgi:carboxypeptidase Taq